jgi:hypothetical protein
MIRILSIIAIFLISCSSIPKKSRLGIGAKLLVDVMSDGNLSVSVNRKIDKLIINNIITNNYIYTVNGDKGMHVPIDRSYYVD